MVRCAVVEDERENRDMLRDYIFRFNREKNILLWPFFYSNAADFLSSAEKYDLVLMDIRMPGLSGMDAARILRERDEGVQIVFITSLASYALQGYEVGALNYIVKPVSYPDFALKLARTLKRVKDSRTDIHISGRGKVINLSADDILYLEASGHGVFYHTSGGTLCRRLSLASCEEELPEYFCRTNSCYIVNLLLADSLEGSCITVGQEKLRISEPRLGYVRKRWTEIREGS